MSGASSKNLTKPDFFRQSAITNMVKVRLPQAPATRGYVKTCPALVNARVRVFPSCTKKHIPGP
jgi:hypothetical protein